MLPVFKCIPTRRLDSVKWNGGMEQWNGEMYEIAIATVAVLVTSFD